MSKRNLLSWLLVVCLLVSALGVGVTAIADSEYITADVGNYKVVTEVPEGSLIIGQTPKGKVYDAASDWPVNAGNIDLLTDGKLATSSEETVHFGLFGAGQGATGAWRNFIFDLGESGATVQEFLLGSVANASLREVWVKVYAANEFSGITTDTNVVAEKKSLTADELNIMLKAEKPVTARYINFSLYTPAGCAWGEDTEGYGVGPWYDARRIGEMAVYAAPQPGYTAADVGNYKVVTEVPEGSLIIGQTPKGKVYDAASDWPVNAGNIALLTDGKLATSNEETVHFGLFGAGQGTTGAWRNFIFDLGEDGATVQEFLLGSVPVATRREVWVKIYAGNDIANLAADANVVAEKKGMTADELHIMLKADQPVTARYIGFGLYTPAGCAWGNDTEGYGLTSWSDVRRIGEMAVYAAEAVEEPAATFENLGGQVRSSSTNGTDLRFGFKMACAGITYAESGYERVITADATVSVDGSDAKVTDFGVVVSLNGELELTLEDAASDTTGQTKSVTATNLYAVEADSVTFTAVVVNIPTDHNSDSIYARPYVVTDAGTVYGEIISRSVNDVTTDSMN